MSDLGTIASAKMTFGSKLVSGTSVVSVSRTISGIDMMPAMRMASSTNIDSGLKISLGTNLTTGIAIASSAGVYPSIKALSNTIMASGRKTTYGAAELKIGSSLKTASMFGAVCGNKIYNPNTQGSEGTTKVTVSSMPNASKLGQPTSVGNLRKSRAKLDIVKADEHCELSLSYTKTPRKTREEDEKDFNKLYRELSDIGRPILRSMRYRFAHNEVNCNMLKRPAESLTKNLNLEIEAKAKIGIGRPTEEQKSDGPVKKKLCLDLEKIREAQENLQSEVPAVIINNSVVAVSNS